VDLAGLSPTGPGRVDEAGPCVELRDDAAAPDPGVFRIVPPHGPGLARPAARPAQAALRARRLDLLGGPGRPAGGLRRLSQSVLVPDGTGTVRRHREFRGRESTHGYDARKRPTGRAPGRAVGIHARAQKVLAGADPGRAPAAGPVDRRRERRRRPVAL